MSIKLLNKIFSIFNEKRGYPYVNLIILLRYNLCMKIYLFKVYNI